MKTDFCALTPYFRCGLLYFPEVTVAELRNAGLAPDTSAQAERGLSLDDREHLSEVRRAIDTLLSQVDITSPFMTALTSEDAYCMLTGQPLSA
jgi:hypothetical protein